AKGLKTATPSAVKSRWLRVAAVRPLVAACGDDCVFVERVGLTVHELCPFPEGGGVHWEDVVGAGYEFEPGFELGGLGRVLFAGEFDAGLNLAQSDGRQEQRGVIDGLQPSHDGAVRFGFA